MRWPGIVLEKPIKVDKLFTFYYKEASNKFEATGEQHDFWELVYVDKGSFEVLLGACLYQLAQGEIIFYKPHEYHAGKSIKNTYPNLVILSFECRSPSMSYFENRKLLLNEEERIIIARLLKEALEAFDPPVDSDRILYPQKNQTAVFGCEQLIANYLEILLVLLIRRGNQECSNVKIPAVSVKKRESDLFEDIHSYMREHVYENLTVENICCSFGISRSSIMNLFKKQSGSGVKKFFNYVKIEKAREMIRTGNDNFTQIASKLSFSSVNYFSKLFKQYTRMTPTEYARSVKAR